MRRTEPPRDRRRARTLAALLALTALALLSLDSRFGAGSPLAGTRAAVADAFGPLERGAAHVTEPLRALASRARSPGHGDRDGSTTVAIAPGSEAAQLRAADRTAGLTAARVTELDAMLGVASAGGYATVPALVIAVSPPQSGERTVTIDAGSLDGLTVDLTVVNGDGVVGRVIAVARTSATVQLVTDRDAAVGARLDGSQQLGVARGTGTGLGFALFDPLASMHAGDRVVTFGSASGTAYVGGLPLGTIASVHGALGSLDRTAVLTPYADMTTLDLVGVLVTGARDTPRSPIPPASGAAGAP